MNVVTKWALPFQWDICRNSKTFIAGVECEIEAVKNAMNAFTFSVKQDGSLRNKHAPGGIGHEFISEPQPREDLVYNFNKLHSALQYYEGEDPFSSRTSTHVHVNCLPLEVETVRNIVLMYALFEEFFFLMVKPERRNNIHCVPLSETTVSNCYSRPLPTMVSSWSKYTALNLKPLAQYGTLEFRHLHGTKDEGEFSRWLKVLENLWTLGQEEAINRQTLRDSSNLEKWFDRIFSPAQDILQLKPQLKQLTQNNVIDVKFSIL